MAQMTLTLTFAENSPWLLGLRVYELRVSG